ncbi:tRNA pseudouridine(38-40) synthase TruA [Rosettibacter firmus]|uniref:tRNA pseudouridine(38-40) synthase TruA n=1 Tax=Rosettibacter firmus TaxID=3111522 RepID=UPI00336BDDD7
MARFKLYIEYEGTRYSGWQKQKNAKTIQGKLIEAAEKIFKGEQVDIQGSGRTDAGVHALCQVAHMDVQTVLAPEIIKMKLNDELPSDINILEVEKTTQKFHARYSSKARSYIYQISKRRTAFGKPFVWWIKDKLDFKKMKDASKLFIGMHDFKSFAELDSDEKSTKVLIEDVQMKETDNMILIRIVGSHFLWKQVRRMVGVLVEIGRGKLTENDLLYFLENESNTPSKYTAPPSGLFLEKVLYDKDTLDDKLQPVINL